MLGLHFTPACVLLLVCSLHFTHSLHFTPGPQSAVRSPQSVFYTDRIHLGSLYVSGKLPTYPSPKLTLTLTSHSGKNVGLGEGSVGSFPEMYNDLFILPLHYQYHTLGPMYFRDTPSFSFLQTLLTHSLLNH